MMTDPKRLVDAGTELEARLLSSALEDAPGRGLERRVQAALGIGSIAIGAGTASTTAAAASKTIPVLSFGVAKWIGIVAIGTSAAVGAVVVHHEAARSRRAAAAGAVSPAVPRSAAQSMIPATPPPIAMLPPAPALAPVTARPDRAAVASLANPSQPLVPAPSAILPAETATDLVSELAMLDGAHRALDFHETQLALATLDRHDLAYAHGDLAPESLALRIEAYSQRHDDAKMRELGQSFLARYPAHPQSRRVQSLMDESAHR